ncbi:protein-tyrosine phosphatase family protein [[Pseudomonas] carboxydohydrogena]|nr:protein-tyrosine phosphatase family protein [[Pseudomonas] carboxydohydrogena]
MIHVCSLAELHPTVAAIGASHIITVMGKVEKAQTPASVLDANHLRVSMDDITEIANGFTAPAAAHIDTTLDFIRRWDRRAPLVVHCFAGISRSTATAFMAVCALNPDRDENDIASAMRAASPSASPNRLIVQLADRALGRDGRMIRAVEHMGPGAAVLEGRPFQIHLE